MTRPLSTPTPVDQPSPAPTNRRVVVAGVIGTVVEWYDFYLYGTAAALVFGRLFYPVAGGPTAGVLLALATYGVGYVVRPVGGILLSRIGDRVGRRRQLMISLLLMGTATGLVGLLPTYAAIGVAAPVLLLVLRLVQGVGAGAEFGGALTLIAEYSPPGRRGLRASLPAAATALGILAGNGAFALLTLLPAASFDAWGWRVPFLVGFLAVAIGTYIRSSIPESEEFRRAAQESTTTASPVTAVWQHQRRNLAVAMIMQVALSVNIGVVTVFGLSYATHDLGVSRGVALLGTTLASASGLIMAPLAGRLADRFGARNVLIVTLALAALQGFVFFLLLQTRTPLGVVLSFVLLNSAVWMITGASGAFLTALFHVRNRTTGIALAREGTTPIAGLTPLACGAIVASSGSSVSISILMTVVGALAVATLIVTRAGRR